VPALIATYTSAPGGSERLLLDVARGLSEPPLIACPSGWLADRAREQGFVVFELPQRSLHVRASPLDRIASGPRLAAHARELRGLIRDVRPDALIAWGMRTAIAAAAAVRALRERPPLVFEHVDFLPGPAIARAVRAAAARADFVVCLSRALADDLDPDRRLSGRIRVVPCGVDADSFRPGDAHARAADVLLLGAIVPWKRPDLALEIAAAAARELPDLRLKLAGAPLDSGGDGLLARLRERAGQPDLQGHVDFAGPLDDPRQALRDAGCLLHCADREPFGLVLVEALASGTPVVAPAAGGPAEIVDDSCGALYPPGQAQAGADALLRVLRERRRLSPGARRRAQAEFSLERMQERYEALLGELAPRQPAAAAGAGIALVTVTHNSADDLARLAASAALHLPAARLIVIDNASADDSRAVAESGGATLVAFEDNRGFGTAANAGVAEAGEPITVLINPDVELIDDSLARLAMKAQQGRLLAPLLLNADGTRQDSAHPMPASAATALHALVPAPVMPGPLRRVTQPWRATQPRPVAWATAACLVAETDTLRRLGPFDESIFLYAEDLDLGLRAAETWFHPEARVIHRRAHSTVKAFGGENYDLLAQGRRDVVRRRLGRRRARFDDVIELLTFADRAALRRLAGRSATRETERFRARLRTAVRR
jgi:glycosyltransferase involved in cell wall biosynthesis/GT2 family glycosyltransferase